MKAPVTVAQLGLHEADQIDSGVPWLFAPGCPFADVLRYIETVDGELTIGELAEQIAAWENDKPIAQISSTERKRVYVALYQCHLPKMDDVGVVSFDKSRGRIGEGDYLKFFVQFHPAEAPVKRSPEW